MRIERHVWKATASEPTISVVFGLTSRGPAAATPQQLLAAVREHWAAIESGQHYRRDFTFGEDRSPVRDPNATPCYAALRCLAIFLAVQHKRTRRRPEAYHLPDFLRHARARPTKAIRWFTHAYRPP